MLGELPDDLATRTAGRAAGVGGALEDDADAFDFRRADLGHHLEDGGALGAAGQPVRGVLHVAPAEDGAVRGLDRGTDQEVRAGRVGAIAREPGRFD